MMVSLEEHLRRARAKRWRGKTKAEKQATAAHASRSYWSRLTPTERSAEMKRRAAKRRRWRRRVVTE
jgi:hypothetical protein